MIIVLDNSVLAKTLLDEPDRLSAREFLISAYERGIAMVAPSLMVPEFLGTCLHNEISFEFALKYLDQQKAAGLVVKEPSHEELILAEKIAKTGSKNAGFPGLNDSIYHAMAVVNQGVFITADKRHIAKTAGFEHVCLLADWETLIG